MENCDLCSKYYADYLKETMAKRILNCRNRRGKGRGRGRSFSETCDMGKGKGKEFSEDVQYGDGKAEYRLRSGRRSRCSSRIFIASPQNQQVPRLRHPIPPHTLCEPPHAAVHHQQEACHHTFPLPGEIKHTPQAVAPSPAIYQAYALPPESFLGFYSFLEKLTEKCGVEICRGIFGTGGVSRRCCIELVGLGQGCHKGLLKTALALPKVAKFDKKKIQAMDVEISSNCVLITNLKGKSSSPILP
ncbi:hypothetical protein Salat_1118600 [Sesamum alatum]|uniref:Prolamin-like domain-containing protein n=1 Tax=Sesamum alatum TaxID=300844 RepID=A0AAE2CT60_9LAMI|nr:hypothetical protein Salat_1118600 [Sesamum alatum]